MQPEPHDPDGDDLYEIWRSAQHRRTEEVWFWLIKLFKKHRSSNHRRFEFVMLLRESPPASEESAIGSLKATD
jgi:hypothetical protein